MNWKMQRQDVFDTLTALGGLCIILGLTLFDGGQRQLVTLALGVALPLIAIFYDGSTEEASEGSMDHDQSQP